LTYTLGLCCRLLFRAFVFCWLLTVLGFRPECLRICEAFVFAPYHFQLIRDLVLYFCSFVESVYCFSSRHRGRYKNIFLSIRLFSSVVYAER
jgi:hypothetical protein